MKFINLIAMSVIYSFVTFILEDPNYYNLSSDEVGANLGYIGMISEVFVIVLELFMGVIIDTIGRKAPLVIGLIIAGVATAAIPLFKSLYPGYLILRILIGMGTIIPVNIPLLPDYV